MPTSSSWPRKRSVTSAQDAKWTSAGAASGKIISTLVLRCSGKSALEKVEKFWGLPHFLEIICARLRVRYLGTSTRIGAGPKADQGFSHIAGYHLSTFPRHSPLAAQLRTLFLRIGVPYFGAFGVSLPPFRHRSLSSCAGHWPTRVSFRLCTHCTRFAFRASTREPGAI
jgi:hypothetical protein